MDTSTEKYNWKQKNKKKIKSSKLLRNHFCYSYGKKKKKQWHKIMACLFQVVPEQYQCLKEKNIIVPMNTPTFAVFSKHILSVNAQKNIWNYILSFSLQHIELFLPNNSAFHIAVTNLRKAEKINLKKFMHFFSSVTNSWNYDLPIHAHRVCVFVLFVWFLCK